MQTFRDFMESALYDPERGFYSHRIPTEDFYTAPELHPAFGGVLTREIVRRLAELRERGVPEPFSIVEMGSGSGLLAREILKKLEEYHPDWAQSLRYVLVERSKNSLLESVTSLSAYGPVLGYSRLEEVLPCSGVFFSNELVDAFPVHLLEKREGSVYEVYVEDSGRIVLSELSTEELKSHAEKASGSLEEGERHAVNLEAPRWLKTVSEKLQDGFLITVDYGKRFNGAPNQPRTFLKHTTDGRLTELRGFKDITASVDFEALIAEGARMGLELESYNTLGRFLIDGGIEEWLPQGSDADTFKSRTKVKTLIHPEAMGEVFKVLIQRKETAVPRAGASGTDLHKELGWRSG